MSQDVKDFFAGLADRVQPGATAGMNSTCCSTSRTQVRTVAVTEPASRSPKETRAATASSRRQPRHRGTPRASRTPPPTTGKLKIKGDMGAAKLRAV
jgi:hypothetical protein